MHSRSLTFLFIFASLVLGGYRIVSAAPQTYEAYQTEVNSYCNSSGQLWGKYNTLVPKIDYSELSTNAINDTLSNWRAGGIGVSDDERLRLKRDLDPVRIGEYSGFKTLEIARVGYRTRMNSAFACAVISSRQRTLVDLQKLIGQKIKTKSSEILEKLQKEGENLEREYKKLTCNPTVGIETIINLSNTASLQYCTYRHYLSYLDSNIEDVSRVQNIETGIGQGSGTQIATTTSEWNNASFRYQSDLSREIIRADTTLPKAIRAFIEMDQTYAAHILLQLVYDDYIRLRKALSNYMNLSSQLYQKANNAQSTNK